ncbi:MAG: 30S ribosomal protein S2 [Candidatus Paceibacterota bacterium]
MTKIEKTETAVEINDLNTKLATEMVEAGVLYGHKKSKVDPRMRRYIAANRHEIDLLDVKAVEVSLNKSIKFLEGILGKEDGLVLFIGTTSPATEKIKEISETFQQPYVTTRWLGGTLTNYKIIKKRINHYLDLQKKEESGELDKYTKKERVQFSKEINKMSIIFEGLVRLTKLPDALFVINPKEHSTAIREARNKKIPVVSIIDTNDNPDEIDYPIIANDHSVSSIGWVIDKIIKNIKK